MEALFAESAVTVRHDLVIELVVGDVLELRPRPIRIELVTDPSGPATADPTAKAPTDLRISLSEPGRYHFRCHTVSGAEDLHVMCVEPAALAHIAAQVRTVGHGDSTEFIPLTGKARGICRALANHSDFFDGTAKSLESRSLAPYGA
jgi:hypothetical protein